MNIYQSLFDLLNTHVFGGQIVSGSYEELVTIFFSMTATLFMIALPFLIVYAFLRMITGVFK